MRQVTQPVESSRPRRSDGVGSVEQQIFVATERLLGRISARDLSVAQILKEAGISRGTFYHYFSSKSDVVNRLAAGVMDDIYTRIEVYVARDEETEHREVLERSIAEGVKVWRERRAVVRAIVEHWRDIPEIREMWLAAFERMVVGVARRIDLERASGAAPPGIDSRRLATAVLWSTTQVLYAGGLAEFEDLPDEAAAQECLLRLWLGAIYA